MSFFNKIKEALRGNGVTVDTVLDSDSVNIGETLSGRIVIRAENTSGPVRTHVISAVSLSLQTKAEDDDWVRSVEVASARSYDNLTIKDGEEQVIEFTMDIPWNAPLFLNTGWFNNALALKTEISIPGINAYDVDYVKVWGTDLHGMVLDAMQNAGWRLVKSDIEYIPFAPNFVQEFEFKPNFRSHLEEIEIVFEANDDALRIYFKTDGKWSSIYDGLFYVDIVWDAYPEDIDAIIRDALNRL